MDSKEFKNVMIVIGLILLFCLLGGIFDSTNRCAESDCNSKQASDSIYCNYHRPSRKDSSNTKRNTSSSTKKSSHYYYPGNTTYNSLNFDPDDYDSPEDFADDAWGVDFDDWDDAYDYWENY